MWTYSGVRPLCDDESDSPQAITRDYTLEAGCEKWIEHHCYLSLVARNLTRLIVNSVRSGTEQARTLHRGNTWAHLGQPRRRCQGGNWLQPRTACLQWCTRNTLAGIRRCYFIVASPVWYLRWDLLEGATPGRRHFIQFSSRSTRCLPSWDWLLDQPRAHGNDPRARTSGAEPETAAHEQNHRRQKHCLITSKKKSTQRALVIFFSNNAPATIRIQHSLICINTASPR